MKNYTDIEQSRKLAEILSLESADMCWQYQKDRWAGEPDYEEFPQFEHATDKRDIPCWSLAALEHIIWNTSMDAVSCPHIYKNKIENGYYILYGEYETITCSSIVDACVDMIEKFKNRNLL